MRLVIDIGNTRAKVAVFSSRTLFLVESYDKISLNDIKNTIERFPTIRKSIYSSVANTDQEIEDIKDYLEQKTKLIIMNENLTFPIINHYLSPKTLGKDRLAGVIGAKGLFSDDDCLVIDSGSCITVDFIDKESNYYGGSISPGINMKYKALNTFTESLPLINDKFEKQDITGADTEGSIKSGVLNGTLMEIEGYIKYYCSNYPDIKILFTGGDARYLQSNFKENTILEEHLVLLGLNIILDTNA
ncbi:MAG TPA: type III pantothenate kinase [Bacteroidales bacterium]|nr:type III pantothenate kinase [Bacteroidales bacterium]